MPIFEYKCKGCNHEFDTIQGKDEESAPCPECGCEEVEKRGPATLSGGVGSCGAPGKKSSFS
jgi:putative FmdB family regulatory protein